eukprot:2737299-Rhodomonas_salina.1
METITPQMEADLQGVGHEPEGALPFELLLPPPPPFVSAAEQEEGREDGIEGGRGGREGAVSYTHLTLPTIC